MTAGRWTVLTIGAFATLLGVVFAVVGTGLLVVSVVRADDDGFVSTPAYALRTDGHAITSGAIDLEAEADPAAWLPGSTTPSVRLDVAAGPDGDLFVGVAARDQVAAYLAGVRHAVVTELGPGEESARLETVEGRRTPTPPGAEPFWTTSASGPGALSVEWEPEAGEWSVVVMRGDAGPGVATEASVGVRATLLTPVGTVLLVLGILALGGGVTLILAAVTAPGRGQRRVTVGSPTRLADRDHPVAVTARLDDPGRALWLVKWLLVLPHVLVLVPLWIGFVVATVAAGVAILVTGRYPPAIFRFTSGVLRWTWRVAYYSYGANGTDAYPPFSLDPVPGYPTSLDIAEPGTLSRGLVLIKWWLLALPHLVVVGLLTGDGIAWTVAEGPGDSVRITSGGLIGILVLIAAIALLVTGRYPPALFDFVMGCNRWVLRVGAYVALMTDVYPPFRLDQGGAEPGPRTPLPGPPGGAPPGHTVPPPPGPSGPDRGTRETPPPVAV